MRATSTTSAQPRLTPAGTRVLAAASELFYRRGIAAVGVELVAEAAGVTKKTLYDTFGSKAKLVAAYLRARDVRWRTFLTGYVDEHGGTDATARVLAAFDGLGAWMRIENPDPRGCGFVNAAAELTDPHHPGRSAVAEQKHWVADYLAELVAATSVTQPDVVARQLVLLYEGACVAHGLGLDSDPTATARAAAVALLAGG